MNPMNKSTSFNTVYRSIPSILALPSHAPATLLSPPQKTNSLDISSFESKLRQLQISFSSAGTRTYSCRAEAEERVEFCEFEVQYFGLQQDHAAHRVGGCPCLFRRVLGQIFPAQQKPVRMFRCLSLPQELETTPCSEVSEVVVRLETSAKTVEQQYEVIKCLSALVMHKQAAGETEACRNLVRACPSVNGCVKRMIMTVE
jgi:hypothetical protein